MLINLNAAKNIVTYDTEEALKHIETIMGDRFEAVKKININDYFMEDSYCNCSN